MAMTAMQAVERLAKEHGIKIHMIDDLLRDEVLVVGQMGEARAEVRITKHEILSHRIEDMDKVYSRAYHAVIDELLGSRGGDMSKQLISRLELELAKYKDTVRKLSFQLEMAERGGKPAMLKEDEVRRLALEQAAEHLMDHGVITSGKELVEVCEQIKKLQRHDVKLPSEIRPKLLPPWSIVELKSGEVPF